VASAPSHAARALPPRRDRRHGHAGEVARYLGAVSVLLVGAVHAQQYYDAYFSVVPTIGTLESGYRLAVVLTLLFDVMTTAFLGFFLVAVGPRLIHAIATEGRTR
jgi:hypothetical protein